MIKNKEQRIKEIDKEIEALYNEHGYYAPFDPMTVDVPKYIKKIKELEKEKRKLMEKLR